MVIRNAVAITFALSLKKANTVADTAPVKSCAALRDICSSMSVLVQLLRHLFCCFLGLHVRYYILSGSTVWIVSQSGSTACLLNVSIPEYQCHRFKKWGLLL